MGFHVNYVFPDFIKAELNGWLHGTEVTTDVIIMGTRDINEMK